jgi:hypothetical protein
MEASRVDFFRFSGADHNFFFSSYTSLSRSCSRMRPHAARDAFSRSAGANLRICRKPIPQNSIVPRYDSDDPSRKAQTERDCSRIQKQIKQLNLISVSVGACACTSESDFEADAVNQFRSQIGASKSARANLSR